MPTKTPENSNNPADFFVSRRRAQPVLGEPDMHRFYLGPQLHSFLLRTAARAGIAWSNERVLGKHYIPGEQGKTGIHVLLKQFLGDTRPYDLPTLIEHHIQEQEMRHLHLDIEGGMAGKAGDIRDVISFLNAAVQLADAVPGAEYRAIAVSKPPDDMAQWFEAQRTDRTSGWRRSFEDAPRIRGRRLPIGAFDRGDLDKYILWL